MPLYTLSNNCLTHAFMYYPRLKCSMSKRFMIHMLYRPRIHCAGSNSGALDGPSPLLSRYLCATKFGNFVASKTSWSKYVRLSNPPTMLSLVLTSLEIFDITILSSTWVWCMPCVLVSTRSFFFPCGDGITPSFSVSFSGSSSRICSKDSMAGFAPYGPFPLDASDFVCTTSSSRCSGSFVDYVSSSTCKVVFLYSGVCISSTSTTFGISLVPPYGPCVVLQVVFRVLLGAPTRGSDMVVKFKQKSLNLLVGSAIPHFYHSSSQIDIFLLRQNHNGSVFPPLSDIIACRGNESCIALILITFSPFCYASCTRYLFTRLIDLLCIVFFNRWFSCNAPFCFPSPVLSRLSMYAELFFPRVNFLSTRRSTFPIQI
jgi:hypothetical protein